MRKLFVIKQTFIMLLSALLIQSCSNDVQENNPKDVTFGISESHLEDINTVVELYENSFLEVLDNEKALKSISLSNTDKSEQIFSLFQEKLEDTFGSSTVLKSTTTTGDTIDTNVLQGYMDEMADRLLKIDVNTTSLSKDETICLMSEQRDLYLDEIKNDGGLVDWEKTIILENVMLSSEMIFITLRYSENLEEIQLKSLGSWYEKNKQKIECTIKTATAVAACAAAATTQATTGVWLLWLKCVATTAAAVNCWAQL